LTAENGVDDTVNALHTLSATEGMAQVKAFQPDLILLDIHLPDIDGIALYKAFKKAPQTRASPSSKAATPTARPPAPTAPLTRP
jgi:CheY-like chemotaxis protein